MATEKLSPGMQQYLEIKADYPDAFLLFRMGDFYELFYDDAVNAAQILELTLTSRNKNADNPIPMAGVPYHSVQQYIDNLVDLGHKVAIAEQMEDPKQAKGVVKREVVQVITPGTAVDALDADKENNYLTAVDFDGSVYGFSYIDLTTGEFYVTQLTEFADVISEAASLQTKEILFGYEATEGQLAELTARLNVLVSNQKTIMDNMEEARLIPSILPLVEKNVSLKLLTYIKETQKRNLSHIQEVKVYEVTDFLKMDYATKKSLELTSNFKTGKKQGTLLWLLDETKTAMGTRMMKSWIDRPLIKKERIENRQKVVQVFLDNFFERVDLVESLKGVYDIERLSSRISFGKATAPDFLQLRNTLSQVPQIKAILEAIADPALDNIIQHLNDIPELRSLLEESIAEDAPRLLTEGGVIKDGYDEKLDEYRQTLREGTAWIAELEARERQNSGINGLRIDYNRKDGYYFHVTNSNLDQVPDYFFRKATLKNSERYGTEELAKIEGKMIEAREKSSIYEYDLFMAIRDRVEAYISQVQALAKTIAGLDCLQALAVVAETYQYVRPNLQVNGATINIVDGRHAVVEKVLGRQEYVPNNINLSKDVEIQLITGPNMSGKSTYMRQLALTAIMAQLGSYVPAESATLPIFDAIFTRIGASDDLTSGQSTFMVEMMEANNALRLASKNSLILFDELGRGTATYDGMALAQGIIEYIHNNIHAKTLFATHYHELTELDDELNSLENVHVATLEQDGDVTFLHKIENGPADKSYGIHVAKIAGLPKELLARSQEILDKLENQAPSLQNKDGLEDLSQRNIEVAEVVKEESAQLDLFGDFGADSKLVKKLSAIDVMNLTPMDAMNIIWELKKMI
ncbi:DNA mismatch repair protein MutS [Floricoccus penangensis]|uniref:DNA mismatch repair protein MutS n=1 Tax=Floricoccus penangensis TaxID=1859475 RepID=A0A9Q5P0N5_9LACT|nr:DNA mismatch repair protein MutS [Floricoccus penangensis]OFI47207.1 DNA mismatch repair protein MutS [Floricoccus penangensis]